MQTTNKLINLNKVSSEQTAEHACQRQCSHELRALYTLLVVCIRAYGHDQRNLLVRDVRLIVKRKGLY